MKTRWTEDRLRKIALAWIAAQYQAASADELLPDVIAVWMNHAMRHAREFTAMLDAAEESR